VVNGKVLVFIGGHLCTDSRPQKETETLANAGHDLTVYRFWFNPELVERDRPGITLPEMFLSRRAGEGEGFNTVCILV